MKIRVWKCLTICSSLLLQILISFSIFGQSSNRKKHKTGKFFQSYEIEAINFIRKVKSKELNNRLNILVDSSDVIDRDEYKDEISKKESKLSKEEVNYLLNQKFPRILIWKHIYFKKVEILTKKGVW